MNINQVDQAVSSRAAVRVSERNGWAKGMKGIALGYNTAYDTIKVGFVDDQGKYTGESTPVSRKHVDLIDTDAAHSSVPNEPAAAVEAHCTGSVAEAGSGNGSGCDDVAMIARGNRRCWSVSWPEYTPVDVTPPELLPSALAQHVPGWAEGAPTPDGVHDWAQRQADALVSFELDARGWPLHPQGRTGRNLGRWGENAAADPIVVAGNGHDRRVLLITRDDIGVEAIPGGMVDPGETAPAALVRELREETGVDLSGHRPTILGQELVDDWRNSDHAWVASTSALYRLPATVTAIAADDALDANWWPFGSFDELVAAVTAAGRTLYAAHRPLLERARDHLNR